VEVNAGRKQNVLLGEGKTQIEARKKDQPPPKERGILGGKKQKVGIGSGDTMMFRNALGPRNK